MLLYYINYINKKFYEVHIKSLIENLIFATVWSQLTENKREIK